jgi:hypothetical protein
MRDCYTEGIALSNVNHWPIAGNGQGIELPSWLFALEIVDDGGSWREAQRRHSAVALAGQGSYEVMRGNEE